MKKKNIFPVGWDEKRIQAVIDHYENQTEEEALAEDEAAFEDQTQTLMLVPNELMPIVRELIARYEIAITKAESLARKERVIKKNISKI
jgi:hypothetical protein